VLPTLSRQQAQRQTVLESHRDAELRFYLSRLIQDALKRVHIKPT
jgi:hypothetical protein